MKYPRLLICEGASDKAFFNLLIQKHNLPGFHIKDTKQKDGAGGNSQFAQAIRAFEIENPGFSNITNVVIAADNDESPQRSFSYVCSQVEDVFGVGAAPTAPLQKTAARPSLSILMIPNATENGNLESLCVEATRNAERRIGACVDRFLASVNADRWENPSRYGKAWLRTSLAVRCERNPFIYMRNVFTEERHQSLIPLQDPSFNHIIEFLRSFAPTTSRQNQH